MALSDSIFLFELRLEELTSYVSCTNFFTRCEFANIFSIYLREPIQFSKKELNKKKVKRNRSNQSQKHVTKVETKVGQSILVRMNSKRLLEYMKCHPIRLYLWNKRNVVEKIGTGLIPWSQLHIDYIERIDNDLNVSPLSVSGEYNIFDDFISKRIAAIKISIKVSRIKMNIDNQLGVIPNPKLNHKPMPGNINGRTVESTLRDDLSIRNIYGQKQCCTWKDMNCKLKTAMKVKGVKNRSNNALKNKTKAKANVKNVGNNNINRYQNHEYNVSLGCQRNLDLTKSESMIHNINVIKVIKSKSLSNISPKENINTLNYIFGDPKGSYGNKIYCVGYFTVQNMQNDPKSSTPVLEEQVTKSETQPKIKYKLKICDDECPSKNKVSGSCSQSSCSLDLPEEAAHLINITKCKQINCNSKKHNKFPPHVDENILIDLTNLSRQCCNVTEVTEEVIGGMTGKMKIGDDPCYCSCECRFGFTKKTTYCNVCGGYEIAGEELARKAGHKIPLPCPIYHKLVDKNKLKTWSTSGSDSKKKGDSGTSQKNMRMSSNQKAAASDKRTVVDSKNVESEKDAKKEKKKKKDDKFKFNYGYKAPQIGHSQCALPCTGTLGAVPKNMGWLWTAENLPGIKFRPMWKPGATNKHVVRLLRLARNPGEVIAKKRRKDAGKKKRPLKRPLLIVHKKHGEYTVTMETMKSYLKPRALNQCPYEDKPVITYTIGRTEEENRERRKKKEREQRRLERAQRDFIQSAFRDMCHEICLKTYQQALGILPGAEDPDCTCFPAEPTADRVNMDVSCSCSEEKSSIGSDTDSDEWIVEFTPPNAAFDPKFKPKKIFKADNGCQYTYLDYRVKLLDRFGSQVPRFFTGPDGKQLCSDLGGFWSTDRKWLEINVDGYIAPDGRWAPNNFIGPSGEQVDAEIGKFQATNGKWLIVGVDGYVDSQGKWRFYPKPKGSQMKRSTTARKKCDAVDKKEEKRTYKPSEASWSCFGDVSPRELSGLGIVGHGQDRRMILSTLQDMLAHGEDVRIPEPSKVFYLPQSKRSKNKCIKFLRSYYDERTKCQHSMPSDKGIVAVDEDGNKTYFRLRDYKNRRPKERLSQLTNRGISLSSFHVPCFHSFINCEIMKQQQRERLRALAGKNIATQVS